MRNKPRIRFKGFTEDWEQRKLCQITTRVTRKNGDQSDLPLTISAQDGLVDQRKYFNRQVASRDMSNYYLIKKGEFAYNKSYSEGYPFGAVKRLDYYDIGALSTLYILFEITDNNISSDFIVSYYMTHLWYKEISKRAAEGARNHGLLNISTEDFFDSELNIPNSIEEQVKIGNFIKQFDKFITLHQRKLEKLKLAKKALLQKLFPKNGSKFPELRFKGFADAWEQRKLGEFVKIVSGDAPSTFISGNCVYVKVDDLNYSDRIQLSSSNLVNANPKAHLVNQGATIFPKRGAAIMTNKVRIMGKDGYLDTNMMALIPEEIDKDFLFTFIQKTGLYKIADTSTIPQINNKHIEPYMIQVPSEKEQAYIGVVFKKIDKIITLHQCKLDKLQEVKKGLLQKMFV